MLLRQLSAVVAQLSADVAQLSAAVPAAKDDGDGVSSLFYCLQTEGYRVYEKQID